MEYGIIYSVHEEEDAHHTEGAHPCCHMRNIMLSLAGRQRDQGATRDYRKKNQIIERKFRRSMQDVKIHRGEYTISS